MNSLDKYQNADLSPNELSEITDQLMRSKYDYDRQQRWKNTLAHKYQVNRQSSTPRRRRLYFYVAGAAAAFALLLTLALPLLSDAPPSYQKMVDEYLSADFYEHKDRLKGDQNVAELELLAATAYNRKDFATAIDLYTQIIETGTPNFDHYLFLGLSELYSNNYTAAITHLRQAKQLNPNSRFRQETQWFLALSLLKSDSLVEGRQLLMAIKPDEWNYEKAQLLLQALE